MSDPETTRQTIAIQPAPAPDDPASAAVSAPWRIAMITAAPHRLGFFLAMVMLIAASLWWLLVQMDRYWGVHLGLGIAQAPTITHAVVMVFGFMPLFFSGFAFTAGPQWLGVPKYTPRQLLWPLLLQTVGWLLWLAGAMVNHGLALFGVLLALLGLGWMYTMFWRLIGASERPDQIHARAIGSAGIVGVLCLAALLIALLAGQYTLALALVRTALWGFVVVTFVSVAHRMIPFFTHGNVPAVEAWRPYWILALMIGVAAFEVLRVWVGFVAPAPQAWPAWTWVCIVVEAVCGLALLWLVVRWGLIPSLRIRLLGMLHIGFFWFGLSLLYSALGQYLWLRTGSSVLGLGPLHAFAMGFLGSLILAMVTRVTCGHSGRPLVADNLAWGLFLALQVTVLVRLFAAAYPGGWTALAALLWAAVVTIWGGRYLNWYGRPRTDGKPG